MAINKLLIVGKIGAPYGIKGWIKIHSTTKPAEALISYWPLYINDKQSWIELKIKEIKPHGKLFIAHIEGASNPEEARRYTNRLIGIYRHQLPEAKTGEYYWTDLEGLEIITQEGVKLGKIDHFMETGANDVMVVVGKKRHLIPYLKGKTVIDIDLQKKVITVDWDEEF